MAALLPRIASGTYYQVDSSASVATDYPWITPAGTTVSLADDATSGSIGIGFTFNFGGTNYTNVQIGSNGWIFFGTTATTFTNTALPAAVDTVLMPFWTDQNPNSVASRIQYQSSGSSPNRIFTISYVDMPHYCNGGGACTGNQTNSPLRYTYQVQLHETTNDIIFWYSSMGSLGGSFTVGTYTDSGATIGVEIDNSDYTQFSFNTNSIAAGNAIRFYYNPISAGETEGVYQMDETSWAGADAVLDTSGNGYHGTASGSAAAGGYPMPVPPDEAINSNPGTCGAGFIPSTAGGQQVNLSGLQPDANVGNTGTIAFWYSNSAAWNDGNDRMLLDASNELGAAGADKHFYLVKEDSGTLVFALEDSADTNSTATTAAQTFAANTWVHVAVTWNLSIDRVRVYINGTLSATSTTNVNGTLGNTASLYVGDQRFSTITGDAGDYTANSANGYIDELKIYSRALFAGEIATLMTETHSCGSTLDHFQITHGGTGVNCQAENVTFTAHDASHNTVNLTNTTIITVTADYISGTTGGADDGDWSVVTGTGSLNNGTADDGVATYTFPAGGENNVVLGLKDTWPQVVNINVTDGSATEASGTGGTHADANLEFKESGFRWVDGADAENIVTQVAGTTSASYSLQAIRTDTDTGACTGVFANGVDVTVELASQCNDPTTCAGQVVTIVNNAVSGTIASNPNAAVSSYTSRSLRFGANSKAAFTLNYPDVGKISLHARYNIPLGGGGASSTNMLGASNQFVVKPSTFTLDNIIVPSVPGNCAAGSTLVTAGTDETATPSVAAGTSFCVRVTAKNSSNATTPNYGQEVAAETVALTPAIVAAGGAANPALQGSFGAFTSGIAEGAAFYWDEVGIITLTPSVGDADYLGAGEVTGTVSANVGRFKPSAFTVTANTPTFTPACSSNTIPFTYIGQAFDYGTAPSVVITAVSTHATTTTNYDNAWWKLGDFTETETHDGVLPGGVSLDASLAGHTAVACSNCNGTKTIPFTGPFSYVRPSAEAAPFTGAVDISFSVTDSEGVAYASNPFVLNNIAFTGGNNDKRWGRLSVGDAAGDGALPLDVLMQTEYWDGTTYQLNVDDDCTTLDLANDISLTNTASGTQAGDQSMTIGGGTTDVTSGNPALVNGIHAMTFSAPGSGNNGFVEIAADLSSTTGGNRPWLIYDWDGDGTVENTAEDSATGQAVFGIIQNPRGLIYIREPW